LYGKYLVLEHKIIGGQNEMKKIRESPEHFAPSTFSGWNSREGVESTCNMHRLL